MQILLHYYMIHTGLPQILGESEVGKIKEYSLNFQWKRYNWN